MGHGDRRDYSIAWYESFEGGFMRGKICQVVLSGLAALSLLGAAAPAMALQSARQAVAGAPTEETRALAARVIAITTPNMEKQLLDYMATVIAESGLRDEDARIGAWMEKNAGPILITHIRTFMGQVETVYATRFTAAELQAMVDFYESPLGRTVAEKQVQVGIETGELQEPMLLAYMTDLMTQLCAANDCGDGKNGAGGKSSRR